MSGPLFDDADLTAWLGEKVTVDKAVLVERVVWGWLKLVLGAAERPTPVPDEVFSWAIELGGIAHENPAGLTERELGPYGEKFSAERRQAILDEAAANSPGGTSSSPRGSFPPALPYPDPAR